MTHWAECPVCKCSRIIASGIRELTKAEEVKILLRLGWSVVPRRICNGCKEIAKKYPVK